MNYYFDKFPTIFYENLRCRDVTKRVQLEPTTKNDIMAYNPLEITAGFRSDSLASAIYDDSSLDWLVYLSNDVMDPYHDWYLSERQFNSFITKKYGSVETAQEKIKFYQNNWYNDNEEVSVSFYNNTLAKAYRKYYKPVYGERKKVLYYIRKNEDWTVNTNRILMYTISLSNSAIGFSNGEIVDIKTGGEIVGGGEVIQANSSILYIQHVSGNTSANVSHTKIIIGETSGANATANAVTTQAENFGEEEGIYWSSVSYYDWEQLINESKKTVKVLSSDLTYDITDEIRRKLQE